MIETVKKNIYARILALDNKGLDELKRTISKATNVTDEERKEFYDAIDAKIASRFGAMVEYGEMDEGAEPEDR